MTRTVQLPVIVLGLFATMATPLLAADNQKPPSPEEMWRIIQQQDREIENLKKKQKTTDERLDATGDVVEEIQKEGAGSGSNRTQIGGYAEMHYNGGRRSASDQIDLHRFVLFFNHDFTDSIRFFSELEVEHALVGDGDDKPGEVEVEQAFVEFDLCQNHQVKTGLFLLPIGILNETHEPPTFFGVERNPVEKNIIPTTWWEGGVGYVHRSECGLQTDLAFHSGLNVDTSSFKIRGGRQKVAEADADDYAATGRVKYTGIPGVEVAASAQYQQDITQGGFSEQVSATLFTVHTDIRKGPWGFRALYGQWDLDGSTPESMGRDEQFGWYVEPAYYLESLCGLWGFFARYNVYDNTAGGSSDTEVTQFDVGVNFWPHEQVVLKGDIQTTRDPSVTPKQDTSFNLGVGVMF